jgi:outer membrane lipase/esterase
MKSIQNQSLLSVLLISTLLPGWALADTTFERMCIFGDSLSDTGNVFEVTNDVSTRPYDLIPSAPYPIGGPTFTNGRSWIQHFAESFGRNNDAKPAFRGSGPFCNYSFGGARARQRDGRPFDLPGLVARYLADKGGAADTNTLYIVSVGGNDIRDALEAPAQAGAILNAAVQSIFDNISALVQAGATKFLVVNAPNLGLVPAVTLQGAQDPAQFLSVLFNSGVAGVLGFLPSELELMTYDLFSLRIRASRPAYVKARSAPIRISICSGTVSIPRT